MALYEVTAPDGVKYEVEGPEGATDQQLFSAVRNLIREEERARRQAALEEARRPIEITREEEAGLVENILTGFGAGAVGLYESAALGVATALEEGNETEARRVIQEIGDTFTPEGGNPEDTMYQFASAVGSIVGILPTAILGPLGLLVAGGITGASGAGIASERAREEGATEEERSTAALQGIGAGVLDILPLGRLAKTLKVPFLKDVTEKLGPDTVVEGGSRILNAAVTGGAEAAQEAASEFLQNAIESGYNPDQELVEGLGEAATMGGAAGAFVDLVVNAFVKKGSRGNPEPSDELLALPAPRPELGGPSVIGAGGALSEPVTLPDGSVATTAEELAAYQERRLSRTALPAPKTEEELIAEGDFEEVARRRALAERRQGDLFGQEQQPPTRLTPQEEQELDAFGAELGLTQEQIDEFKARQGELFEGQAPSPQAVPRLEGPPSEQELVSQGDFEAVARRREQEAVEAERRQRVEQEAEATRRAQAVEQAQRTEAEQAQRDRQLAEAGRPMVEEQARRRLRDEQEMFPLERERAQAEPTRPTEQRARYIDQQQELEGVETRPEAEARRQREEQGELFGPRGGVPRRAPAPVPSPRAVAPDTRQPTQEELLPREEPEQGELLGPRGGARRRADFEAQQPQRRPATATRDVSLEPKLVTKKVMSDLGIPAAAPVRKRIEGRDMSVPEDAQFVRSQLTDFSNNPNVTQGTKFKITKFLEGTPDGQMEMFDARQRVRPEAQAPEPQQVEGQADVESRQPEPETSRASVQASEPSPRRRQVEPEPERAVRATTPEPTRLEGTERDTTDVVDRERDEQRALEEAPAKEAKAPAKPKPKRKRQPRTVQVPTPTLAKTKTPPPPPPRELPAGQKSITTQEEVKTKTTTRQTPAGRVAMRVASKADQDLRSAHEEKNLLVGNPFFEFVFMKTRDSKATDADKTAVAKLIRKTADTAKSKKSSKTPNNAARIYFGKHSTIESSIELIATDYVFPIGDKQQTAYQKIFDADLTPEQRKELGALAVFNDETQANEDAYMQGQGNHFTANAARTWVLAHLSPEMKQLMADRIQYYTSMQEALNRKEGNERRRADPDRKKALARLRRMKKRADLANDFVELNKAEAYAYGLKPSEELLSNDQIEEAILQARETERAERRAENQDMRGLDISVEGQDWLDSLLPSDAVSATSAPLHPSVIAAMDTGITVKALQFLAATTSNNQVRNAARKLIKHIGTTKIEVVDKLGPNESGKFNPKTNTITLSAESGMNTHTLLHETAHAVTSAAIADPKLPVTKQLTKLFESVKDQLDTAYGATNLDEFVAEAFSNPEFRMKLAGLTPKGDQFTALERFTNAVMNLLRRLVGMQTKPLGTALSEADALIEEILAPAPESRNAGELLLISKAGPQAVADFANEYGTSLKNSAQAVKDAVSRDKFADNVANFLLRSGGKFADTLRGISLMTLPSQAFLTDVLGKLKVKAGAKLHELFQNQEADINLANRQLDGVLTQLQNWQKGKPEQTDIFNKVVHNSTIEQVDPTKNKDKYEGKETQYDAVKALYDQLDPEGKRLYVELRDTYKKLYQRMQDVLNRRIDNMVDEAGDPIADSEKRTLKEKVFGKLFEQGRIEPYFPLVRRGDYWLEYDIESVGIDGETTTERVVRAFETKGQRQTAIAQLKEMPEVITKNGEPVFETNDDKNKVNFRNAPPVSFVGQTLKILNANNISKEVQQEFINLFIDTLPEASFAKSLRKREGTLGFEEDAVLAFRTKAYDVARQTVRLEYTQKINAQVRAIENEIDEDRDLRGTSLATVLKEEVAKRGEFATNPPNDIFARAAQQANRLAFLGTIGFNISSAIVNMSQIPAVVLPFMAGKTTFAKATRNLNTARKFFAGAGSESSIIVNGKQVKTRNKLRIPSIDNYYTVAEDGTLSLRDDLELSDEKNINVHGKDVSQKELAEMMLPLVQEAMNQGQLNHSLFFDTQGLEQSGKVKYAGDGLYKKAMRGLEAFNVISATPFHTAERFNRQVTLAATYLNELQRLNEANEKLPANQRLSPSEIEAEAVRESLYETQQTNGGAVLATAPRIAQKHIGRVAMMYKTFGIQMYYTQLKTALSALESSGLDAEQRRIAKRQIIATQLSVLMLSGVQGVTIYGMAAAIANMFLDDDEPDAETITRTFLGEGLYKGGVNQLLALAGAEVDVASRIGLSNLILQTNRYNFDPSMEKTIVQTLGGPFYGYGSQITRGVGDLMDGEVQRGVENILPAAFRNASKTLFRYGDEGVLTRRKDPIMDDIGPSELAAQFFGFAPAEYTLNQERNQVLKKIEKSVNDTRTKLLRQYYIALRTGDREAIKEVGEEMMKFSKKHPTSAITADSIQRSMRQHMKTSATMYNGVTLSPNMRGQLVALGEEFE